MEGKKRVVPGEVCVECSERSKLIGLGVPEYFAHQAAGCRRGYWWTTNTGAVKRALTKERLVRWGFYDLTLAYQSVHVNY